MLCVPHLGLWLLYTLLSSLMSTAGTMILPSAERATGPNRKNTRLQISKGTNPVRHFPEFPLFRLNLPPATNPNHLPSIPVQGNWSVPVGVESTIPPTHLGRKQQPHRESCPPLTQVVQRRWWLVPSPYHLMNSVTQAICAKADNSNSSPTGLHELRIYILQ